MQSEQDLDEKEPTRFPEILYRNEKCTICQSRSKLQTIFDGAYIGRPPILLKDLMLECLGSSFSEEVLTKSTTDYALCSICIEVLHQYYDATQLAATKRDELLNRLQQTPKSGEFDEIEVIVNIQSIDDEDSNSTNVYNEGREYICNTSIKSPIEQDAADSNGVAEELFAKIIETENEFEDVGSFNAEDENTTQTVSIERMPNQVRYCWRCDASYPTDDDFDRHLKLIHTKSKKPKSKTDYNPSNISKRRYYAPRIPSILQVQTNKDKVKDNNRSFVCQVCDFKFKTAWNLKRHQQLHCFADVNRK